MEKFVNKNKKVFKTFAVASVLFAYTAVIPSPALAAFRFIGWGDSRDRPTILSQESNQVKALNPAPALTVFSGDLCGSWSTSCATAWVGHINGGSNNGIGGITFPIRGNHDSGANSTAWSSYFNIAQNAARVGATNYSEFARDMTYSFDYQNAHFVGLDNPGGDVSSLSSAQITWLDNDLRAAEARGKKLSFLFWHGPLYYMDSHAATAPSSLVSVINNHPSVAAVLNGHEHVLGIVELNNTRMPGLTNHKVVNVISGTSGAPHYSCRAGRSDFCQAVDGFSVIDVISDTQYKIAFYKVGTNTPIFERTYTKGGGGGPTSPPGTPTPTPVRTPTPRPSGTGSRTPTPTSGTGLAAVDINGDRTINIIDIGIVVDNYGRNPIPNPKADINKDGSVNIVDIGLIIDKYNQSY
jgi:hypothetical protein